MSIIQAIIIAIVEGITEFLPVSSTGHMIIASSLMGIADQRFTKLFTVAIQLGAIMSVLVLYFKRFFQSFDFYFKLLVAFIPAAVMGILFNDYIDAALGNPLIVAVMLLLGGIVLLFVDDWFRKNEGEEINYPTAFKIGAFQVLAMLPGVSRSAATIIGGMTQGLNRRVAAEFSFFLAMPTMFGATAKSLYEYYKDGTTLTGQEWLLLGIGNVVAFIVALLAIRTFIDYLSKKGFRAFGWYRIIVGLGILLLYAFGISMKVI